MPKQTKVSDLIKAMVVISDHFSEKLELPISFPTLALERDDLMKITEHQSERLLSPADAARMMGLSPKTIANWRSLGTEGPKFIKIGSRIAYRRKDVMAFIAECVRQSTSEMKNTARHVR